MGDLKRLIRAGALSNQLESAFEATYGRPSASEAGSWAHSLPALAHVLGDARFDGIQVLIELQMPIGAERADVVLLGGHDGDLRAFVIELKQWSAASMDSEDFEVLVPGNGPHQHHSIQALNYRGKLLLFQARAADYDMKSAMFLHNLGRNGVESLTRGCPAGALREAPLFGAADGEALAKAVEDHLLPVALRPDEYSVFNDAPYQQSRLLFDILTHHARDIATRAVTVLAESGIGLTEEQDLLANDILRAVREGARRDFIVTGGPGSGKTLLAVSLLLQAFEQGSRCLLAIRNNRLQAILRKCFDVAYPGASGVMIYFEATRTATGLDSPQFPASSTC